jgi:hypothetical protein
MQTLSDLYKTEKELKKDLILTRIVIFEKCRQCDLEIVNLKYWFNKKGNVIRVDNGEGTIDINKLMSSVSLTGATSQVIGFKSTTYLEPGYVFAPYIPINEVSIISESSFVPSKNITTRYATRQINSNLYGTLRL